MHPPTFLNYARAADPQTTVAAAVVVPYRSSLLFNPAVALATDFSNQKRFTFADSHPFEEALIDAILHAAVNSDDHLEAHALMVPNRFDTLDWMVCAPLPRPAGAVMRPTWRYTMRTGVSLPKLLEAGRLAQELIGRKLPGRRLQAAIGAESKEAGKRTTEAT